MTTPETCIICEKKITGETVYLFGVAHCYQCVMKNSCDNCLEEIDNDKDEFCAKCKKEGIT